ncbi:MAG: signal peptide peptidase SppA [Phycisphaeraceae bacterium]|nr:signal peptide peptidase SppA [Phycisphaeraceae bacterium]
MTQTPGSQEPGEQPTTGPSGPGGRAPINTAGLNAPPPPPPPGPYGYPPGYGQFMMAPPTPPRRRWWWWLLRPVVGTAVSLGVLMILFLILQAGLGEGGVREVELTAGAEDQRIVVLPIEGVIDEGTVTFVRQALGVLRDHKPAAVVLRVESPGGEVGAADRTWHMLKRFKDEQHLKIVASYGGQATSGGYYVSMTADEIIAEPTCVTGSIGVLLTAFTLEKAMEKLGITPEVLPATGATRKDQGSMFRSWTPEDRTALLGIIDHMQERFITVVEQGRGLSREQVRVLATGEPFTTPAAIQHGLVDAEGYLDEAIERAKVLAGIPVEVRPQVTVVRMRAEFGPWSMLGMRGGDWPRQTAQMARAVMEELNAVKLEYRTPLR